MKRLLTGLSVLLLATAAQAEKISWANLGCGSGAVYLGNGEFQRINGARPDNPTICRAAEGTAFARDFVVNCNGTELSVHVVDNDRLIFGDELLFRVTEDGAICD